MRIREFFRTTLIFALSLQLAVLPGFSGQAWANSGEAAQTPGANNASSAPQGERIADPELVRQGLEATLRRTFLTPSAHPEVRALQAAISEAAEVAENGLSPEQARNFNPNNLLGQRLEILDPATGNIIGNFDLSAPNVNIPTVAATNFNVVFRDNNLVVEGLNANRVIARHIVPQLPGIISIHRDAEVLLMLASNGATHAIDMPDLRESVFKGPIVLVKNVDQLRGEAMNRLSQALPAIRAGQTQIQFTFQTVGLRPFAPNEIRDELIQRRTRTGQPIYSAGDAILYITAANGQRDLLTLIPRDMIHLRIAHALTLLLNVGAVVAPESLSPAALAEIATQMGALASNENMAAQREALTMEAVSRRALGALSARAPELMARLQDHHELTSERRHQFTYAEWEASFRQIQAASTRINLNALATEARLGPDQARLISPNDLGQVWQPLLAEQNRATPTPPTPVTRKVINVLTKKWVVASLTTTGVYMAGYNGYGPQEFTQAVFFLNEKIGSVLPIFKDLNYLLFPGAASVAAQFALLAGIFAAGSASIPLLGKLAATIRPLMPTRAAKIQEVVDKWKDTDSLRRIVGLSMRFLSVLVPPVFNQAFDIARQPNFLQAAGRGLNPFRMITPESPAGRAAGLHEPVRLGIANPFAPPTQRLAVQSAQSLALGAYEEQALRRSVMASLFGTLIAAEEFGVDPATLVRVANGNLSPAEIDAMFRDPAQRRYWQQTVAEIYETLRTAEGRSFALQSQFGQATRTIPPEEIAFYYQEARAAAERVRARHPGAQVLTDWRRSAMGFVSRLGMAVVNFGRADATFLRNTMPPEFVVSQLRPEILGEYKFGAVIPLFLGDRANPANPHLLMAQNSVTTGFTHPYQWFDAAYGMFGAAVLEGGQMAIQFHRDAPTREGRYSPPETSVANYLESVYRDGDYEGLDLFRPRAMTLGETYWSFFKSLVDIRTPGVLTLPEALIQGHMIFLRRVQVQISVYMAVRMGVVGQSISEAFLSSLFTVIAGYALVATIWQIPRVGMFQQATLNRQRAGQITEAIVGLSQALRTEAPEAEVRAAYEKLAGLYDRNSMAEVARDVAPLLERAHATFTDMAQTLTPEIVRTMLRDRVQWSVYLGQVAKLQLALDQGNRAQTEAAYQELQEVFREAGRNNPGLRAIAEGAEIADDFAGERSTAAPTDGSPATTAAELQALETVAKAEGLLSYAKANPPLPTLSDPRLRKHTTWFAIVASTVVGVGFINYTMTPEVTQGLGEHLKWALALGAGYTTAWFGLRPKGRETIRQLAPKLKLVGQYYLKKCEGLLLPSRRN